MDQQSLKLIVTEGDDVGSTIRMPTTTKTTFNQLISYLNDKFGPKLIKVHPKHSCSQTVCSHTLEAIGENTIQSLLGSFDALPISIHDYSQEITIQLVGMSNIAPFQKIHTSDYVHDLKVLIAHQVSVPSDEIELTATDSDSELNPEITVEESDLHDMSTVQVGVSVKGGSASGGKSFAMINVFDDSAVVKGGWGKAPKWQEVAPGSNIEGICRNNVCRAYKCRVCANKYFEPFNMGDVIANCPVCSEPIEIDNLTFSECFYTIRGREVDTAKEKTVPWRKVGDYWQSWNPEKAKKKKWAFIQVIAMELSRGFPVPESLNVKEAPVSDTCTVCQHALKMSDNIEMRPCCHSFHRECWKKWNEEMLNKGEPACCPLC